MYAPYILCHSHFNMCTNVKAGKAIHFHTQIQDCTHTCMHILSLSYTHSSTPLERANQSGNAITQSKYSLPPVFSDSKIVSQITLCSWPAKHTQTVENDLGNTHHPRGHVSDLSIGCSNWISSILCLRTYSACSCPPSCAFCVAITSHTMHNVLCAKPYL